MAKAVLWQTVLEPEPPLAPTKAMTRPIGGRLRVAIDGRDGLHDLRRLDGGQDIFADAAAQELAIEQHVVDLANGDDLAAGIADLCEPVEVAKHVIPVEQGFDDDQVRSGGVLVEGDGRLHASHLHRDMGSCEPPVLGRFLDHRSGVLVLAKGLDVDARDGARTPRPGRRFLHAIEARIALSRRARRIASVADH
jgi:hypothetical protein